MKVEEVYGDTENFETIIYPDKGSFKLVWLDKKKVKGRKFYEITKRILDFGVASTGIIIIFPIMIWIALKVHIEEPNSSVIFKQKRIGVDGRPFTMYKFRSMCIDAEKDLESLLDKNEIKGAMFKIKEDPRVTEFGKFIRRTSLDELPQLINVIKGDMSLIGPRPPLQREVAKYTQYDKQRLMVKPGCSGTWQVSGRNGIHFDEMVKIDIEYIQRRSIRYDISLIIKTVKVMMNMSGAY